MHVLKLDTKQNSPPSPEVFYIPIKLVISGFSVLLFREFSNYGSAVSLIPTYSPDLGPESFSAAKTKKKCYWVFVIMGSEHHCTVGLSGDSLIEGSRLPS